MPYIGRGSDNGFSIRNRYIFVATSGQQDFSGADANSNTLALEDGFLTDVFVNGIMIKPTADYTLNNSTNTLSLVSAASTSDEITILVYQIFSLSDAMPTSGGTFSGGITGTTANFSGNITGNLVGNASTATALQNARTIGGTSFDGTANIAVGLSATATALANARTIGGVSFDGTANINLPGVNATGNQNTSGTAATVTTAAQPNITSVGTLGTLKIGSNTLGTTTDLELTDNAVIKASSSLNLNATSHNFYVHTSGASTGGTGSSTSVMGIDANGDLALSRAETNGTVRLNLSNTGSNGSTEFSEIKLNSTAGGTQTSVIQHRNNYGLNIGTTTDHAVYFLQNNANAMAIDTNGNIGIGGTAVNTSGSLYNGATFHILQQASGSSQGSQLRLTNATTGNDASSGFDITHSGDTTTYIQNRDAGSTIFYNSGYQSINMNAAGQVTNPRQPFFHGGRQGTTGSTSGYTDATGGLIIPFLSLIHI